MSEKVGTIVFEPPSKDEPGYLKRVKKALQLREDMEENPNPKTVDEIVEFLIPYVKEPQDRNKANELLWEASEDQFMSLMELVGGQSDNGNPTD